MGRGGGVSTFRKREIILAGSGGNQQGNIREKVKATIIFMSERSRGGLGGGEF